MITTESIHCPNCGAPGSAATEFCAFCGSELIIRSFATVAQLGADVLQKYAAAYANDAAVPSAAMSAALCNFALGLYDRTEKLAQAAIDEDPSSADAYLYYALAKLGGRTPFTLVREEINLVESYLSTAAKLSGRADILLAQAFVRYDYYHRKGFYAQPTFVSYLLQARRAGLSRTEAISMFELMKVSYPTEMFRLAME